MLTFCKEQQRVLNKAFTGEKDSHIKCIIFLKNLQQISKQTTYVENIRLSGWRQWWNQMSVRVKITTVQAPPEILSGARERQIIKAVKILC